MIEHSVLNVDLNPPLTEQNAHTIGYATHTRPSTGEDRLGRLRGTAHIRANGNDAAPTMKR